MAPLMCRNQKRTYYITVFISGIVIFLVFSWNGIWGPRTFEVELDQELDILSENLLLKSPNRTYGTKLFDLDFKYILSPNHCSDDEDILAVVIVTSHYNNVETRSAMRRSFSNRDLINLKLRRFFLLGQTPDNVYMTQVSVLHESKRFNDIIQGNFLEAYRNLTYKHVMGVKWASENCPRAQYVIKMDDDIVFDVKKVVNLLGDLHLPNNSIGGYILRNMKPIREPANKWYVTKTEYRFSNYPSFVSGWFYVTTPQVAARLALLSHYFKYFWIDDVFVTGVLAKNLKIKQYDLRKYFTVYSEFLQCCIADMKKRLECDILIGPNGGDNNMFYEFNEAVKICQSSRCDKRVKPINETCVAEKKVNLRGGNSIVENYKLH